MNTIPVIALDVDGVLSPILKDSDWDDENEYRWRLAELNWPLPPMSDDASWSELNAAAPWIKTDCMDAYVARPVADFLREVHESGRAEVMWHSTWGMGAKRFEKALDLPDFEVLFGRYSSRDSSGRWEKLVDVEGLIGEGRRVIWLDDHIVKRASGEETLGNENLFWIAPGPGNVVGLSPSDLAVIDKVLKFWNC